MLLQLTDVNKIYNGAPLLKHISLTIEDRDRIGLIGVNGCGKSTLLKWQGSVYRKKSLL